ncbi:MAG: phenylacetate--CoA ligase family protein [Firmicutes bacterium]|nr:phenylacetate--CoA ligase family protein [Bacillota bacterium]
MNLLELYHASPIWLQNVMCTMEGWRILRQRYGGSFQSSLDEIRAFERLSHAEVADRQESMLRSMLNYAYAHVPFYHQTWPEVFPIDDKQDAFEVLRTLPLLDRSMVKSKLDAFVSDEYRGRHLVPYPTGGTSGSPLVMRYTPQQVQRTFAFSEARIRNWAGVTFRSKQATFLGKRVVPVDQRSGPFWRVNRAGNQTLFSIFHLNDKTAPEYVAALNKLKPEMIVGYVTPVYMLSRFIVESGESVKFRPRLIWTSSETLEDYQRETIETAFDCRVTNAYSGAEGVALITECIHGGLHISPDFGVIEMLPVEGSPGLREIVGTTLFNFSMPLVRYRTGDLVEPDAGGCTCGLPFPTVKRIIGRLDDTIRTPAGTLVSSAPLSLVFQEAEGIHESQLVQTSDSEVVAKIVPSGSPDRVPVEEVVRGLQSRLGSDMRVRVEIVQEIPRGQNGKFRFIVGLRSIHTIPNRRSRARGAS